MADITSKDFQDFLDSQKDILSDLFFKLENTQKNQSKQLSDAVDKLSQALGQKIEKMQNIASKQTDGIYNSNEISKLSTSIDRLITSNESTVKRVESAVVESKDAIGKVVDTVIKSIKFAVQGYAKSFETTSNQLNYNRTMEINGVINSFQSLRNAALKSGLTLDEFSEVTTKFNKVMISLNASGMRGVEAFQKMGEEAQKTLAEQNISFTRREAYELEGVALEQTRKMGRFQELTEEDIKRITVNTGKIVDSISKFTGQSRSEVMSELQKGPSVIQRFGFEAAGFNEDQMRAAQALITTLKGSLGQEAAKELEYLFAGGNIDSQAMRTLGGTFTDVSRFKDLFDIFIQSDLSDESRTKTAQEILGVFSAGLQNMQAQLGQNIATLRYSNYLAPGAQTLIKADTALKTGAFQKEGASTTYTEKELAETEEMKKTQNQIAVSLQNASNSLRDTFMEATASVDKLKFAQDRLVSAYEKAAQKLHQTFVDDIADDIRNDDSLSREEKNKKLRQLNEDYKEGRLDVKPQSYDALSDSDNVKLGAAIVCTTGVVGLTKGVINSVTEAAPGVANAVKGGTKGGLTGLARGAGHGLVYADLALTGVEAYNRFEEGDTEGGVASIGAGLAGWGGAVAGAELLGATGLVGGPWGGVIGGAIGGIAGYFGGDALTRKIYNWVVGDDTLNEEQKKEITDSIKPEFKSKEWFNYDDRYKTNDSISELVDLSKQQLAVNESINRKLDNVNIYQNV